MDPLPFVPCHRGWVHPYQRLLTMSRVPKGNARVSDGTHTRPRSADREGSAEEALEFVDLGKQRSCDHGRSGLANATGIEAVGPDE